MEATLWVSLVAAVCTGYDFLVMGQALLPNEVEKLTEAEERSDHTVKHVNVVINVSSLFSRRCPESNLSDSLRQIFPTTNRAFLQNTLYVSVVHFQPLRGGRVLSSIYVHKRPLDFC